MKANELMIVDWVGYYSRDRIKGNPYPLQIHEIRNKSITLVSNDCLYQAADLDELSPIPLTPEILEKNGFRKSISPPGIHTKCYEIDDKDNKYCLTIANYNKYKRLLLNIDSKNAECFNIKCDYVHQLQHALRLCGIEKTIVL